MVGRKQNIRSHHPENHMVCRVAGSMNGLQGPAIALNDGIIRGHDVRHKIIITAGIKQIDFAGVKGTGRAVRPFGYQLGTKFIFQHRGERRMIPVRMADKNMADRPPVYRPQQGGMMRVINRTGIDQRQRIAADQIAIGAIKGEGARIIDRDAFDIRRNLNRFAIMRRKRTVENEGHGVMQAFMGLQMYCEAASSPIYPFQRVVKADPEDRK